MTDSVQEVTRLRDELEQLRTLLDASEESAGRLSVDRDQLVVRLADQAQELRGLRTAQIPLSDNLAAPRSSDASVEVAREQEEEELRVAFEELQVVTEKLEIANNSLRQANQKLDDRVEERTRQLADAIAAARANEERLSLSLSVGGLATWDWNLLNDEVSWSDEHFWMLGYRVREVSPSLQSWATRVHPDDLDDAIAAINRARDRHEEYTHEFRVLWPSHVVRLCAARARFYYDGNNRPVRMIGVLENITERREAERALQVSEARFRNFAEASSDVLWIRDIQTLQFEFISPAFERVYGEPLRPVPGQDDFRGWARLILPEDRSGAIEAFRRVLRRERGP